MFSVVGIKYLHLRHKSKDNICIWNVQSLRVSKYYCDQEKTGTNIY